ncbi:hypothetical protein SAMN05518865_1169 [Duganella sp. CF458]|uniref:J domain-containing protein n=1 Tax=Duganella sp. CF458 TaxID=1884368 RepID=UPI0008F1D435|nr:J domain-containing protein [Duganella sp. CF458]SFG67901.1 hypothetical protein SAMN05518865_1169 [Duganella sp. CF458]
MQDITQALAHLGLEAGATDQEVRRAYARALKLIDQETELAAFQALRGAYELAIGLRSGGEPEIPEPFGVDEAQEAFEWIIAAVAVISGGRRIADETIWVDDLREQLAEQQPVGLDAGPYLEAAICRFLLNGWQPGHEALLLAATDHFGWADEGTWPNIQIAEAWQERWLLHRQPETLRAPLVRVIRDLRQAHEPELSRLRRDHGYFELLATYYANLAPIIVDMQMLQRWRELAKPLGLAPDVSWTAPWQRP